MTAWQVSQKKLRSAPLKILSIGEFRGRPNRGQTGQTGYSQPIPKAGIGGSPRFAARTPIGIFERVLSVPYAQVYGARGVRDPDPFRPEAAQHPLSQLVAHGGLAGEVRHLEVGREPQSRIAESGVEGHRR